MKSRVLWSVYFFFSCAVVSFSQITLTPMVYSSANGLNASNISIAESKLRNIISQNNMLSSYGGRFVIACKIDPLQSEVYGTKLIRHLGVSFAIGDNATGNCFGTTSMECLGIGNTEEQALSSALRNIKSNKDLNQLIKDSKDKIVDYYDQNGKMILKKAQGLMVSQHWEEALYELSFIPKESKYYDDALSLIEKVSKDYINHTSLSMLNQARALWASNPNSEDNLKEIVALLSQVNSSSECYDEAQSLIKQIGKKMEENTEKEYKDQKEMEEKLFELQKEQIKADAESSKSNSKLLMDIISSFSNSSKKETPSNYKNWLGA